MVPGEEPEQGAIQLTLIKQTLLSNVTSSEQGKLGHLPGARPGRGARLQASGDRVLTHRAWSGIARKSYMELPVDSPPAGRGIGVRCYASWVAGKDRGLGMLISAFED